jgi:type I restriction enzyme S subunit
LQSKCFQSGTSQQYIYPKDIRRFLIPEVARGMRKDIHALVLESFYKQMKAEQLLDQAKSRVEQLIEEAVKS